MAQYKGAASEGSRAMQLMKKREQEQKEMEFKKKKITSDLSVDKMENKFAVHYDAIEAQLKSSTIGLVTLDEMRAKQNTVLQEREVRIAQKKAEKEKKKKEEMEAKRAQKELQKKQIKALSFLDDEDDDEDSSNDNDNKDSEEDKDDSNSGDEDEPVPIKKKKIGKNPDVDTSFLPDRAREEEENKLREQLRQEWTKAQEELKNEEMEVTYSYWDGSGHRKTIKVTKGTSIYQFLQKCLESLRNEFSELRTVTADQLMYVKEDLILPHHNTFYDLIVTKARGKSGPLFAFHARDDIRIQSDASKEREDSHAGKVLLRNWYERNKHIFPASRWEPYDASKTYNKYTISDKTKN